MEIGATTTVDYLLTNVTHSLFKNFSEETTKTRKFVTIIIHMFSIILYVRGFVTVNALN